MKEEEILSALEAELASGTADEMDFGRLCRKIGVSRSVLDRCLRTSLGISGPQLLKSYKLNLPILFL